MTWNLWPRFAAANKHFCRDFLQPRLYPISHLSAVDWWFSVNARSLQNRGRLLEFGSGEDFPVFNLVGHYFECCEATDVEDIPQARWPTGVTFTKCEPTRLPYDAGTFDAVFIRSVIEHVSDPPTVFRELARVMKPGARVFMNLPNKWDYVSVIARLSGRLKTTLLRNVVRIDWKDFEVYYRSNTRRALSKALEHSALHVEVFRPLPSEPAYLRFFVPFYIVGAIYQFAISLLALDVLQPSYLVVLLKDI